MHFAREILHAREKLSNLMLTPMQCSGGGPFCKGILVCTCNKLLNLTLIREGEKSKSDYYVILCNIFVSILIRIPISILPNHYFKNRSQRIHFFLNRHFTYMYISITPLIIYVHLGYVCQQRVKPHEWRICHHHTQSTEMFNGGRLATEQAECPLA